MSMLLLKFFYFSTIVITFIRTVEGFSIDKRSINDFIFNEANPTNIESKNEEVEIKRSENEFVDDKKLNYKNNLYGDINNDYSANELLNPNYYITNKIEDSATEKFIPKYLRTFNNKVNSEIKLLNPSYYKNIYYNNDNSLDNSNDKPPFFDENKRNFISDKLNKLDNKKILKEEEEGGNNYLANDRNYLNNFVNGYKDFRRSDLEEIIENDLDEEIKNSLDSKKFNKDRSSFMSSSGSSQEIQIEGGNDSKIKGIALIKNKTFESSSVNGSNPIVKVSNNLALATKNDSNSNDESDVWKISPIKSEIKIFTVSPHDQNYLDELEKNNLFPENESKRNKIIIDENERDNDNYYNSYFNNKNLNNNLKTFDNIDYNKDENDYHDDILPYYSNQSPKLRKRRSNNFHDIKHYGSILKNNDLKYSKLNEDFQIPIDVNKLKLNNLVSNKHIYQKKNSQSDVEFLKTYIALQDDENKHLMKALNIANENNNEINLKKLKITHAHEHQNSEAERLVEMHLASEDERALDLFRNSMKNYLTPQDEGRMTWVKTKKKNALYRIGNDYSDSSSILRNPIERDAHMSDTDRFMTDNELYPLNEGLPDNIPTDTNNDSTNNSDYESNEDAQIEDSQIDNFSRRLREIKLNQDLEKLLTNDRYYRKNDYGILAGNKQGEIKYDDKIDYNNDNKDNRVVDKKSLNRFKSIQNIHRKENLDEPKVCQAVKKIVDNCFYSRLTGLMLDSEAIQLCNINQLCYKCGSLYGMTSDSCDQQYFNAAKMLCLKDAVEQHDENEASPNSSYGLSNLSDCEEQSIGLYRTMKKNRKFEEMGDGPEQCKYDCIYDILMSFNVSALKDIKDSGGKEASGE